jgi:hypothetical protein
LEEKNETRIVFTSTAFILSYPVHDRIYLYPYTM